MCTSAHKIANAHSVQKNCAREPAFKSVTDSVVMIAYKLRLERAIQITNVIRLVLSGLKLQWRVSPSQTMNTLILFYGHA